MALSGSLSEFDISNIFLLIEQDGKTGKLIVSTDSDRKVVIFKQGQIINTYNENEDIKEFVFRYLKYVKGVSAMEITELNSIYYRNLRLLSDELVSKGYLSSQELTTIVQTALIDVTSDIFSIKRGEYIFDQHPTVDSYQFQTTALPANFIMLEAARRTDEWGSINPLITPDAVFVQNPAQAALAPPQVAPIENFGEYALSLVNGVNTVGAITQFTFFSSFHIYQAFNAALANDRIRPISQPDIASIRERQSEASKHSTNNSHIAFAAIITVLLMLIIAGVSRFVVYDMFLEQKHDKALYLRDKIAIEEATAKVKAAEALYRHHNRKGTDDPKELLEKGYITRKELKLFLRDTLFIDE